MNRKEREKVLLRKRALLGVQLNKDSKTINRENLNITQALTKEFCFASLRSIEKPQQENCATLAIEGSEQTPW